MADLDRGSEPPHRQNFACDWCHSTGHMIRDCPKLIDYGRNAAVESLTSRSLPPKQHDRKSYRGRRGMGKIKRTISIVTETPNAAITTSWSRPPVTHNVPPTSGVRTSGTGMNLEGISLAQALLMRAELTMHINALTNQLLSNSASPYQVAETSRQPGQESPIVGHKPRMPDTEEGGKKGE